MSRQRYTVKDLAKDIQLLNAKLKEAKSAYYFRLDQRNGFTAIDLATPEQLQKHTCTRNLELGTPRQCLAACHAYLIS
jgi:hypothetical protein